VKKNLIIVLPALLVGFINGFFGGGGGMLAVPLLTYVLKLEQKKSHATAIAIILPLSLLSATLYFIIGNISYSPAIPFTSLGVLAGGIAGALLLKKISNKNLSFIFYLLMIAAGIYMVVRS
jgi:hypothetical protein